MTSEAIFQQQIRSMMYAFGDAKHPHSESALLVEEFARQQMRDLVSSASRVTSMRDGRIVLMEDVIFLLRKDQDQLKRLLRHLELKGQFKKAKNAESRLDEEELIEDSEFGELSGPHPHGLKRVQLAHDFLTPLQKAELKLGEVDELEVQRLEEQDALTKNLSTKEYLEFTAAKSTSLYKKNIEKFKEWIGIKETTSFRFNPDVIDVFGHLAHETVRKLVKLSLHVKSDMSLRTPRHWPTAHTAFGQTPTLSDPPATRAAVGKETGNGPFVLPMPTHSPPPITLGDSPLTDADADPGVAITSSSLRRSSRESRKRQRGSDVTVASEPEQASDKSPHPLPPATKKPHPPHALKPVHIREALRRLEQAHLTAPVATLWTHQPTAKHTRSWCL